jgi:hypothetical protein
VDDDQEPEPQEIAYPLTIKASPDWVRYELDLVTVEPYPGPDETELLITAWNGTEEPVYIDDLQIRFESEHAAEDGFRSTRAVRNGGFEDGASGWRVLRGPLADVVPEAALWPRRTPDQGGTMLVLGTPQNADAPCTGARQVIEAGDLAGRTIRIGSDVSFLSLDREPAPWAALLFVLKGDEGAPIETGSGRPFWCPVGRAARPGTFKRIRETFRVPETARTLTLEVLVQKGVGDNLVAVDNVLVEVLSVRADEDD